MKRLMRFLCLLVVLFSNLLVAAACSAYTVPDGDGYTRAEIMKMSVQEQYDMYRKRYTQLHELVEQVQLSVADADTIWKWTTYPAVPRRGGSNRFHNLAAANSENSYTVEGKIALENENSGQKSQLEIIENFFEKQQWFYIQTEDSAEGGTLVAKTPQGWEVRYTVYADDGYDILNVISPTYWADIDNLGIETMERLQPIAWSKDYADVPPGVYMPYPNWSDPKYTKIKF